MSARAISPAGRQLNPMFTIWLMELRVGIDREFCFPLYGFVVPDLPLALMSKGVSPAAL